ncbi:MAG TPA: hypothetical protein VFB33_01425 [Candidatus Binataceae bacterium]|jgi:hypothetical protein|nr:hypothetical protein [Candidatus Binataceae bacterium]
MKASKILVIGALAVLTAAPSVAWSQAVPTQPEATIKAEQSPALSEVRAKLVEVGRRLRAAKLASFSRPLPEGDYIEAQREVARGNYRAAMADLARVEEQLGGLPNWQ